MPDQYYPEPETETGTDTNAAPAAEPKPDETPQEQTALLPKSILAGKTFNPGDEVVLKVVNVYEDEVEVAYATGDESETAPETNAETASPEMEAAESQLASMAQ